MLCLVDCDESGCDRDQRDPDHHRPRRAAGHLQLPDADPGSDDLLATWHWGDGTPDQATLDAHDRASTLTGIQARRSNDGDVTDTHDDKLGRELGDVDLQIGRRRRRLLAEFNLDQRYDRRERDGEVGSRSGGSGSSAHRSKSEFTDAQLLCYLAISGYASNVFNETRNASTIAAASDVLNHRPPPSNVDILHLDAEILAGWLNFANGSIAWAQLIDTNKDRVPDTPFSAVMATAETVRNNPLSTHRQLQDQRDILKRMNEDWGS